MTSFIVPAYNEAAVLSATLDALHAAGRAIGEPYEIIVSNDGSTDETASIAERHGARVVTVAHRQIVATRNSGAREAKGECFIFVDADTIVNDGVVRAALDAMRNGAVGGGAGVRFDGDVPFYAKAILPLLVLSFRATGLAAGCFVFCTRGAFEGVGGFDEAYFGGEEIIFSQSLKRHGRFVVLKETVVTSGRKLRTHSTREMWGGMARVALRASNNGKGWTSGMRHGGLIRRRTGKPPVGPTDLRTGDFGGRRRPVRDQRQQLGATLLQHTDHKLLPVR